jgi:hypothetical protein
MCPGKFLTYLYFIRKSLGGREVQLFWNFFIPTPTPTTPTTPTPPLSSPRPAAAGKNRTQSKNGKAFSTYYAFNVLHKPVPFAEASEKSIFCKTLLFI